MWDGVGHGHAVDDIGGVKRTAVKSRDEKVAAPGSQFVTATRENILSMESVEISSICLSMLPTYLST